MSKQFKIKIKDDLRGRLVLWLPGQKPRKVVAGQILIISEEEYRSEIVQRMKRLNYLSVVKKDKNEDDKDLNTSDESLEDQINEPQDVVDEDTDVDVETEKVEDIEEPEPDLEPETEPEPEVKKKPMRERVVDPSLQESNITTWDAHNQKSLNKEESEDSALGSIASKKISRPKVKKSKTVTKTATAAKKALKKVKKQAKESDQDAIFVKTPYDSPDDDEAMEL